MLNGVAIRSGSFDLILEDTSVDGRWFSSGGSNRAIDCNSTPPRGRVVLLLVTLIALPY